MEERILNINNLRTISNFASLFGHSPVHYYMMIKQGRMNCVIIDGIKFIDVTDLPDFLRRKYDEIKK